MKANTTSYLSNLLLNFDQQLLAILKTDIQKQTATFINLATRKYDSDLLDILRQDVQSIKLSLSGNQNGLANAG